MVSEILESLIINQQNLQVDPLKRELEILTNLDVNFSIKLKEQIANLNQIFLNADKIEDSDLIKEYAKGKKIVSEIISDLQTEYYKYENTSLKPDVDKALELLEGSYNLFDLGPRTLLLGRMSSRLTRAKDALEQYTITTNIYVLLTDTVNKFWNIFSRDYRQMVMSFTYSALEIVTNKSLYDFENNFKNSNGNPILPDFRETLKEFIKAIFRAQEETINRLVEPRESIGVSLEQGESTKNQIETSQVKQVIEHNLIKNIKPKKNNPSFLDWEEEEEFIDELGRIMEESNRTEYTDKEVDTFERVMTRLKKE